MSRNRRDGSKLSFAERDKLHRDRGGSGRGRGGSSQKKTSHAQKSYRAALERAFADGKVDEFAATLTRASAPPQIELPEELSTPATAEVKPSTQTKKESSVAASRRADRRKLLGKIKTAEASRDLGAAVDRYLAKFDALPNDYEILEKALAHPSPTIVCRVLAQLISQLDTNKPRRSRSLALQLEILEDTGDDVEVRELAARARKKV